MTAAITREQLVALLRKAVDVVDSLHCCADDLVAAGSAMSKEAGQINGDHLLPCRCGLCRASDAHDDAKDAIAALADEIADLHRAAAVVLTPVEVQP